MQQSDDDVRAAYSPRVSCDADDAYCGDDDASPPWRDDASRETCCRPDEVDTCGISCLHRNKAGVT